MQNIDWQGVQRLDNAMNIQFLTAAASILHQHGLITPKEIDNLRLSLSRINTSHLSAMSGSLLLDLEQAQNEILAILKYRFGTAGFSLNLVRLSLQTSLIPIITTLSSCAERLVKKSELVFNRPLNIYFAGKAQYKILASTLVIDLAEKIVSTASNLKAITNKLAVLIPSLESSGENRVVDLEISEALGFSGLTITVLPASEEKALINQIHQSMLGLAVYCSDFSDQIIHNNRAQIGHNLLAASEILKAECLRLAAINFPEGDAFAMWEVRRRHLAANISSITEVLKLVCTACEEAVTFDKSLEVISSERESVKSRLVMQMIGTGTPVNQAAKAASDFLSYLKEKQLAPSQVIAGELSRINAQLSIKCLELMQNDAAEAATTPTNSDMKSQIFERGKAISMQLKSLLLVLLLAGFAPALISCGHKTNPVNESAEFRPDVPFKNLDIVKPDYLDIKRSGSTSENNPTVKK